MWSSADLVVVGAGPAGAMTALLMARAHPDWRIVLLEAHASPRARPCGEFLAPRGLGVLRAHGLGDGLAAAPLSGLRLHSGGQVLRVDFPRGAGGVGVRREELDRHLQTAAVAAGAQLVRPAPLRWLERSGGHWRISTALGSWQAPLVIGADGRSSRVRHAAGLDLPQARWRIGIMARLEGMELPAAAGSTGEMHLGRLGQIGVAPLVDGRATINLLLAPDARQLLRQLGPDRLVRLALSTTPSLADRARRARIGRSLASGRLDQRARAVHQDGLALVGDAAGSWDPFSGDGISMALLQAQALSRCLACLPRGARVGASALAPYQLDWEHLTRGKRLGWLEPLLERRSLAGAAIRLLSRAQDLVCPPGASLLGS